MNCANHPDRERAAFCQNCGKPVCTECVRNIGSSVYCEPCMTARVAGPPPGGYPYPGYPYPGSPQGGPYGYGPVGSPAAPGEPSPGLAALLGCIPGVGAMYNGQYAKGIVHLMVFALLVSLASDFNDIFGIFVFGWMCYMAVEAYHTARARRDGTPLPNPFGLNDLSERLGFGKAWPGTNPGAPPTGTAPGAPVAGVAPDVPQPPQPGVGAFFHQGADGSQTYTAPGGSPYRVPPVPPMPPIPPMPPYPDPNLASYRRFPSGAIWLIVLGLFFMMGNVPFFHVLHGYLLMPILLIGLGVWLFVSRMTSTGHGIENDGTPYYHWRLTRAINGAMWVVITGVIWLLASLHILPWSRSWPIYLIAAGVMMFFKRSAYPAYDYGYTPPPTPPPAAPATTTALVPTEPRINPSSTDQEGR